MNPKKIAIACQGGGSHTAFTAGALITILSNHPQITEHEYQIIGFSGTSGGGICATLAWYGFNNGNVQKSVDALKTFWDDNKTKDTFPFCFPPFGFSPLCYNTTAMNKYIVAAMRNMDNSALMIEYMPEWIQEEAQQALRDILNKMVEKGLIEFEAMATDNTTRIASLYVGAININNGNLTIFKNNVVTLETLLASSAVPPLFNPVEIDGSYYWDGLYSQNPPISNFFDLIEPEKKKTLTPARKLELMKRNKDHKPDEIWIIRINPKEKGKDNIKTPQQEKDRQNELAGNLSLQQELNSIEMVNGLIELFKDYKDGRKSLKDYYKTVTIKEITIEEKILKDEKNIELDYPSKLDRTPPFIDSLIEHGKERARHFLKGEGIKDII